MIDRTFSNTLAIADIAPKAATQLPERADGGFGEALAGAHTVHDRRESQAPSHSRREWAQGDRSVERTRGQDRADEVRSDQSQVTAPEDEAPDTDDATTAGTVGSATDGDDTEAAATDQTTDAPSTTGTSDHAEDAAAQAAATIAVAGAPVSSDLDAIVVPTTGAATPIATDAVDAAIRLAIDADAVVVPDGDVDVEAQLVPAQGVEDAETGDVEAGPTRSTTSAPATTSGPSPVQLGAAVVIDEVAGDAPVVTAQVTQQVATSGATEVAEGTEADGAAQLVQAAAVATDGEDTDVDATVTLKAATIDDPDDPAATVTADGDADAELAPAATGRANATTHVTNQTALAQVQANAQAQAKLAEKAAEETGDSAAPKLEPLSTTQGQPLTAATRDAQLAAGARVREGLFGGDLQDRIDSIADQLATRLRLSQAAGGSQVQLSLKPRELGEVTVQMNVRDGVVAATILVDKADTLRTMQANIEDLKRSLENQGLAIQEFSVDVRGDSGANGANARAAADLRRSATGTSNGSASSIAGAAAVIPGLSGDREVDADSLHDGDVSVLA